ncbi:MAG: Asp-tRNA(Asn)/Glu-tRNA(Gln) amidotransferase subunit GatB, partial [Patescibacteria group bacterium]
IIGLEIHAELKTKSKMFCRCDNNPKEKEPNTNVCPICLGHPGTLPYPNKKAIEWTILLGMGLSCQVNQKSKFDRKHYFYPDLPKEYQISQYDIPLVHDGYLETDGHSIGICRIHLEEDTGKTTHPNGKEYSLVDYNRAGTPLIEMVTYPTIPDAYSAKKFCQRYQQILRYLDISDADMEKGQMRCEANISLQEKNKWKLNEEGEIEPLGGYELNPKTELKNINSFRAIEKAINYEIDRQKKALQAGEILRQQTRGWNEDKGKTIPQREKETSADYRYFPEPDIPTLDIGGQWIEKIKSGLMELPQNKIKRFREQYDMETEAAETLCSDKQTASYTEQVISELRAWINSQGDDWERQKKKITKNASNWLISELFKYLRKNDQEIKNIKITPENFAELVILVYQEKINSSAGQKILEEMYNKGGDPSEIMKNLGLEQIDDTKQLEETIKEIVDKHPAQLEQYRQGKTNVLQFFVGQTMAATQGKANPKKVQEILQELLNT